MSADTDEVMVKLTLMLREMQLKVADHLATFTEDEILLALDYFDNKLNYRIDIDMWEALASNGAQRTTYH
jgi:hypothetical protein